jgi:site-specific DNA-methyltransferase (adenine-specific)
VELLERLIEVVTDPGDLVVDFFAGSASTLVAARNLGRIAIGVEADPGYAAVGVRNLRQGNLFGSPT